MGADQQKRRGRKVYRATSFAKSAMACPGCRVTVNEAVEQCPRCGYTGQDTVTKFPFPAPLMERFIDPKGYFDERERERIGRSLSVLSKKFPQPRLCFCLLDLAAEVDPREFAFWLLNASPVDDPGEAQLRPWTILLLIDDANGRAAVTSGYAIEPFLDDESWNGVLRMARKQFFGRDYEAALLEFIEGAGEILTAGAERADLKTAKKGKSSKEHPNRTEIRRRRTSQ